MVDSHARERDVCDFNDSKDVHMTFEYRQKRKDMLRRLAVFVLVHDVCVCV